MEIRKDTFIPSRAHVPYGKNNEIVIRNLSKNYGKKTALENVSVTIHSGMYGLLGRNGAGKTSLMKILATLSEASGGEISMLGRASDPFFLPAVLWPRCGLPTPSLPHADDPQVYIPSKPALLYCPSSPRVCMCIFFYSHQLFQSHLNF